MQQQKTSEPLIEQSILCQNLIPVLQKLGIHSLQHNNNSSPINNNFFVFIFFKSLFEGRGVVCFSLGYYLNFILYYIKSFLESDMRMRTRSSSWNQHINERISTVSLLTTYNSTIGIAHY